MSSRTSKPGPERDFLQDFLDSFDVKISKGCNLTFFHEPRLESGFPDVVAVVWHEATAHRWSKCRLDLTLNDIHLMHRISSSKSIAINVLCHEFGPGAESAIARLMAAEMIRISGKRLVARPISDIYAVRHVIAIEAKISHWREAINQAFLNTWFATSSFILMPRLPQENLLREQARRHGIGILTPRVKVLDTRKLETRNVPLSYASWLFNEWAWRANIKEGQKQSAITS